MIEVKELFNRASLHQLNQFLINGCESENKKVQSYETRLHQAGTDILQKVKALGLDDNKYEEITNDIFKAFKVYEEVYTELGIKAGARIILQIFYEDEKFTIKKR